MGLEVGQKIGNYEILGLLGAGGMGQVYRVRNTLSDRIEAMKVLLPRLTAEPATATRFMAEIRTLASFDHPNIAQLRTAFQVDNQLVMIMELVEGFTVEHQTRRGKLPQDQALNYTLQLLSALSYAHTRGIVHRDVKPANLMVTPQGVVKLMDFGIAKSEVRVQLTQPGTAVGSLHYMSPEQMRGTPVDGRSDIYSVGILLYEMLAGRRPFVNNGMYSIVHQQLNTEPRPPIEVNPQIPVPLNALILSSLAKDPASRIQSADEFAQALRALTARPPSASLPPKAAPQRPASPRPAASEAVSAVSAARRTSPAQPGPAQPSPANTAGSAGWVSVPLSAAHAAPPAVRATPQILAPARFSATPSLPSEPAPPSFGQRIGWVAAGAFVVAMLAAAAIVIPYYMNQPAGLTPVITNGSVSLASGVDTAAKLIHPQVGQRSLIPLRGKNSDVEMKQAREKMLQLQSRANRLNVNMDRLNHQQTSATPRAHPELNGSYTRMHAHLQAAATELDNRDIVSSRRDMAKAEQEIVSLESFFKK